MDLLRTPRHIWSAMVEMLYPKAHIIKGDEAWQQLASMASE